MDTGDYLLRAILDHPADDDRRLVYADWLEESGQAERAEFIRVQLALAADEASKAFIINDVLSFSRGRLLRSRREALRRREQDLLGPDGGVCFRCDWHAPIPHGTFQWDFHRGFIHTVRCPLQAWLDHGPAVVRAHPVGRVEAADKSPGVMHGALKFWSWAEMTHLAHLERWNLPRWLWELLPEGIDAARVAGGFKVYHDEADAATALSAALLAGAKAPLIETALPP